MKSNLTLFFVLFVFHLCSSQDYDYDYDFEPSGETEVRDVIPIAKRGYLTIKLDAAFPLGVYGSSDLRTLFLDSTDIYFANTGVDVNLNIGRSLTKVLWFNSTVGYIRNSSNFHELYDFFNSVQSTIIFRNYTYKGYHHLYATLGPMLTGKVGMVAFDLRCQFGISYGIDTEEMVDIIENGNLVNIRREAAKDVAFMPQVGISARVDLTSNLIMVFNMDYKHAKYRFKQVSEFHAATGTPTQVYRFDFDVIAHMLSLGLGIGVTF